MEKIKIGDKLVGVDEPCFVIAEVGSNWRCCDDMEENYRHALKLIDIAAEANADAVKFQIFNAESLYSRYTPEFSYLKGENTYELIKSIATPREWINGLAGYCEDKDITFLATPFDFEAVDLLDKYVPAFKMASFEIVDLDLLKYVAERGKPMIVSTGMANLGEIEDALNAIRSAGNTDTVLLHCNSLYPTPPEVVNLRAMETMRGAFKLPIGFSDHTLGIHISLAAAAMGACVIEKHFTSDRTLPSPDHSFAIESDELNEMVKGIREIEKAKGDGIKEKSEAEGEEMYVKARRSVHAKVDILKGTIITRNMLIIKRPGYGIKPKFINIVIDREAKKDIKKDGWITWEAI